MKIDDLQSYQAEYDKQYWEHKASRADIVNHSTLHLTKTIGKLAAYAEAIAHKGGNATSEQSINEVIPDLMQYSFRLSNAFGVDAVEQYRKRQRELETRFGGEESGKI